MNVDSCTVLPRPARYGSRCEHLPPYPAPHPSSAHNAPINKNTTRRYYAIAIAEGDSAHHENAINRKREIWRAAHRAQNAAHPCRRRGWRPSFDSARATATAGTAAGSRRCCTDAATTKKQLHDSQRQQQATVRRGRIPCFEAHKHMEHRKPASQCKGASARVPTCQTRWH